MHTHSSEHTHTVNTHPEWTANPAAPGEQLGVRCLAQGQLSRGIESGESVVHSLPPPSIPEDLNSQPLNYASDSLTQRFSIPVLGRGGISQGTYVRIEQTSEAIRETYEMCRAGWHKDWS